MTTTSATGMRPVPAPPAPTPAPRDPMADRWDGAKVGTFTVTIPGPYAPKTSTYAVVLTPDSPGRRSKYPVVGTAKDDALRGMSVLTAGQYTGPTPMAMLKAGPKGSYHAGRFHFEADGKRYSPFDLHTLPIGSSFDFRSTNPDLRAIVNGHEWAPTPRA